MARVVVTLKIMPKNPDIDLDNLQKEVLKKIKDAFGNTETKAEREAIGFGLNALKIFFVMDENKKTEEIENSVRKIKEVQSVDIIDVRRAIG